MTTQHKGLWTTLVTLSFGFLAGVGVTMWMTPPPPLPDIHAHVDTQYDERLVKFEQAATALTQALQVKQRDHTCSEPTRVAALANDEASRQALAKVIRDEVRQAVADASPEAQRAREEAITEAKILNTPENKDAFQSASSVVTTAVAAKRWTEEDKETLSSALGLLTNEQRMEVLQRFIPVVNRGEIKVEVNGPLF